MERVRTVMVAAACIAVGLAAGGCASKGNAARSERASVVTARAARGVPVFRADGAAAAWSDLVSAAAEADVVMLGENHGHPLGLAAAAALWEDVLSRAERGSLSMEFFERDEQVALDDYTSGLIDERTFLRRSSRVIGGNYPEGHRAMVNAAKAANRPVVAANAPRIYVRLARTRGYPALRALSDEQQRMFRVPDELATGRVRDDFDNVMNENAGVTPGQMTDPAFAEERREALNATFRSQQMWDWTMAESIARKTAAGCRPVVHVVGRFHTDFAPAGGGGTVRALERIAPGLRTVTVSFVDADARSLRPEDHARADFIVYVGPGATE